jgi:hypothetical protein
MTERKPVRPIPLSFRIAVVVLALGVVGFIYLQDWRLLAMGGIGFVLAGVVFAPTKEGP